jgi:hypothetical protein
MIQSVLRIQETCHSALDEKEESLKRANGGFSAGCLAIFF